MKEILKQFYSTLPRSSTIGQPTRSRTGNNVTLIDDVSPESNFLVFSFTGINCFLYWVLLEHTGTDISAKDLHRVLMFAMILVDVLSLLGEFSRNLNVRKRSSVTLRSLEKYATNDTGIVSLNNCLSKL